MNLTHDACHTAAAARRRLQAARLSAKTVSDNLQSTLKIFSPNVGTLLLAVDYRLKLKDFRL
jgi:hypothetical protein